ncbi:hypothetical protein NKF26_08560 [Haladaptatus sp. AB618]|uniref:DUF7518 family protein n=1 Tax=Haladaptatus sp. AB618 TaxID=2934173 RepID=UPI00209C0036|nr:hypothetical protein [Haladaptatus sp. AB618]MCO8253848.1 hypothetical protein [Haladaptatus sp. AB618]
MTSQRDRIGSLESRMEELEATIRGLTEELVDANQRIRELEQAREAEEEESSQAEEAKSDESKDETDNEESSGSESGDDIIVA